MTFRYALLLGAAVTCAAGLAEAQQQRSASREDLLDAMTRHVQICGEITDGQQRLACYDKLQTEVGNVQAPARPAPTPTPLGSSQPPPPPASPVAPPPPVAGSSQFGGTPLTPPPLQVPGGGAASLGGPMPLGPPPTNDPDRAFNPRESTYRPAEPTGARPQPAVRRTGPRPVPGYGTPMPVVTLQASNLTYGESRHWQVTVTVTSNVTRAVDTQVVCNFMNAGRSVGEAYFGPVQLSGGEQVSTELIGPPTTAFVDSTNCRVTGP